FFDLVIGKILTSRLSLSKHLAHNLGNLLLLGKIGVVHNRRNASSRLLLLISKHLRSEERFSRNAETDLVCRLLLEKKKQPELDADDMAYTAPTIAAFHSRIV